MKIIENQIQRQKAYFGRGCRSGSKAKHRQSASNLGRWTHIVQYHTIPLLKRVCRPLAILLDKDSLDKVERNSARWRKFLSAEIFLFGKDFFVYFFSDEFLSNKVFSNSNFDYFGLFFRTHLHQFSSSVYIYILLIYIAWESFLIHPLLSLWFWI